MMRSICPPGACVCGAQDGLDLTSPIQVIGPKEITKMSSREIIDLFRASGVSINVGNLSLSVMHPGVCRHTRKAVVQKLTNKTDPDNDPIQYYY